MVFSLFPLPPPPSLLRDLLFYKNNMADTIRNPNFLLVKLL